MCVYETIHLPDTKLYHFQTQTEQYASVPGNKTDPLKSSWNQYKGSLDRLINTKLASIFQQITG